jgi:hypothetical protein
MNDIEQLVNRLERIECLLEAIAGELHAERMVRDGQDKERYSVRDSVTGFGDDRIR